MRRPLIVLATGALALAGCSDSGEKNDGVLTEKTGGGGGGQVIQMQDIKFRPERAKAQVGETVTWVNRDSAPHNVVAQGKGPKSKLLQKGQKFSWTPTAPGTIKYVCTVHPGMTGTLEVVDS